ncbi:MAG: O-methyltransferase [Bacteroidota bacterium]|nr:O-methyltransferase [Bacteroidota bacterium]
MDQKIFEAVDKYISDLFIPPDEALKAAEQSHQLENIPLINVSPNLGKLLHLFAKISKAGKILEIGTLAGYSTIWMAKALPEGGRLISLEIDPHHAEVARKNIDRAGLSSRVEIRVGKAIDLLARLVKENAGPFDMIFIDADKPPYTEYFEWSLKLSGPGTLIIADNVIRDGKVLDQNNDDPMVKGAQRFNKALAANKHVSATILQTIGVKEYDGMAIAIVK